MKPVTELYGDSFFRKRSKLSWRAPIVCSAIIKVLSPKAVIDVGCGIGDLVRGFVEKRVSAYGIEGSSACLPYLEVHQVLVHILDLRMPIVPSWPVDLVVCFEVAEHIEPEYAEIFASNLCRMSNRLLLSIAGPGQGGHHHVNLQPIEYWDALFAKNDFHRIDAVANAIKAKWTKWKDKPGIKAYYWNLVYYERAV